MNLSSFHAVILLTIFGAVVARDFNESRQEIDSDRKIDRVKLYIRSTLENFKAHLNRGDRHEYFPLLQELTDLSEEVIASLEAGTQDPRIHMIIDSLFGLGESKYVKIIRKLSKKMVKENLSFLHTLLDSGIDPQKVEKFRELATEAESLDPESPDMTRRLHELMVKLEDLHIWTFPIARLSPTQTPIPIPIPSPEPK